MLYIVQCTDDRRRSRKIRAERLEEHLAYIEQHRDLILLGGARLAEDGATRLGSTIILNVPDLQAAVAFSINEPYRRAGLYRRIEIQRMRRAQWRPQNAPGSVDGD